MPDAATAERPYPVPPSPDDERILGPIQHNTPETIPGLIWSKPDFADPDHKIILTFAIDRKKRAGMEMIPCAICSNNHPKFLEGAVLWSFDGWLRVIGHRCAAKPEHFGVSGYNALRKAKQQEDLDNAAWNWLSSNIEAVQPLITAVEVFRDTEKFIESEQKVFFSKVKDLAELLANRVQHHQGNLSVQQELSGARLVTEAMTHAGGGGRASQVRYEVVNLGAIVGHAFLVRPRHKRSRQLESIIEALQQVPEGEGEGPMLDLIEGGQVAVNRTAGVVLRAMQRVLQLAEQCVDAQRFTSLENIALLEKWGKDIRNPMKFKVQRSGSRKVTFVLEDRSRVNLALQYPSLPSLTALRTIIQSGSDLDMLLSKSGNE